MKPLSPSDTSTLLGVKLEHMALVDRLRRLSVPEELIQAVLDANGETYPVAEANIIAWACKDWGKSEESALLILNGKADPIQQC